MSRIATSTINQRGIDGILNNQTELSKVQKQMSTGKRVVTPADDPVAATQMLNLDKNIRLTEQYQSNVNYAKNRLATTDQTLDSVGNLLQRVRELGVRANTASLDTADRKAIAAEVESRLEELVGLANTKDGSGEYLFAGSKGSTKPFTYSPTAGYEYNGDQRERSIKIGPEFNVQQTDRGDRIFMDIERGNGSFVTDYDEGNTGSGSIKNAEIADSSNLTNHEYTIDIVGPSTGNPDDPNEVRVYDEDTDTYVIGAAAGTPPPPPASGQPYEEDSPITFDGISLTLDGEPAVGDQFTVEPSRSGSVFDTIDRMVQTLKRDWSGDEARAEAGMEMRTALQELGNARDNILEVRAELGARINSVESQEYVNDAYTLQMEETLSGIQDLDYAKASGELNLRMVGLQAAQQVYTKVQGLSLFNFIQ